ncbi:MAG: squalene synthase HpnC [candidate division FCPU426 bacterium]
MRGVEHYENFPVAPPWLPRAEREALIAVYAFARQADDFSDEPQYEGRRLALLKEWQALLDRRPATPEFAALADACERFQIPKTLLKDLCRAFMLDCRRRSHKDFRSLADYCRYSAAPVGRIVLRIFKMDSPEAVLESDAICTGLQLANFWQDLGEDYRIRRRVYLPSEDMKRFGVRSGDLGAASASPALKKLLAFEVGRAEAHFKAGEGLVERLGGTLKWQIRLTLLGGRRILQKIRDQDYDTLSKRPRLGMPDLPWFAAKLLLGRLS